MKKPKEYYYRKCIKNIDVLHKISDILKNVYQHHEYSIIISVMDEVDSLKELFYVFDLDVSYRRIPMAIEANITVISEVYDNLLEYMDIVNYILANKEAICDAIKFIEFNFNEFEEDYNEYYTLLACNGSIKDVNDIELFKEIALFTLHNHCKIQSKNNIHYIVNADHFSIGLAKEDSRIKEIWLFNTLEILMQLKNDKKYILTSDKLNELLPNNNKFNSLEEFKDIVKYKIYFYMKLYYHNYYKIDVNYGEKDGHYFAEFTYDDSKIKEKLKPKDNSRGLSQPLIIFAD